MALIAVSDAAMRLGISTRQVQHLVEQGDLIPLARGVLDEASVRRYEVVRSGSHSRAWSSRTAWGAVSLLSGGQAEWMGESQRSRLRSRLREISAQGLVERARARAVVRHYAGHSSSASRLRAELVDTSQGTTRLGLAGTDTFDGYVCAQDLAKTLNRHGLTRNDEGNYTLRATTMDLDVVEQLARQSDSLGALDLAESVHVRERRAAIVAIELVLEQFR